MEIINRIKLGSQYYFIKCECHYKKKMNSTMLCLKNYFDDYYDSGDLSILIKEIEKKYNKDILKKYDGDIWFLSDALYVYDNIPFISGFGDYYTDKDNKIYSLGYITKEELDEYIKANHIKMKDNTNFKLSDQRTWNVK